MNKRTIAVTLLAIVCLCLAFSACVDPSPDSDPYEGYQIFDVMSFNIRMDAVIDFFEKNWSETRGELVCEYIRNSGADVVCLQEVCQSQYEDISASLGDLYSIVYYQRESGLNPEGLAILYTDDFELCGRSRFWLSSTPEVESKDWGAANKRISVNAVLRHKASGLTFNVYTVHLDHISELSRENGLSLILRRAARYDYPALLCGDFNTDEQSDCYSIIADSMQDCRKVAPVTDSGLTYQNFGLKKEKPDSLPIDFCFADNAFKVFEFDIKNETASNGVYYSDHYAITTRIGLPLPDDAQAPPTE